MKHHFLTVASLSFVAFMASSCCNTSKKQNPNDTRLIKGASGNLVATDHNGKIKSGGLPKTKSSPEAYSDFVFVNEKVLARKKLIEMLTDQQ